MIWKQHDFFSRTRIAKTHSSAGVTCDSICRRNGCAKRYQKSRFLQYLSTPILKLYEIRYFHGESRRLFGTNCKKFQNLIVAFLSQPLLLLNGNPI